MQTTTTKQILINYREAIPVRGIPYVTVSFIRPNELCHILADRAYLPGQLFMASHYLDADGTLHTMPPQEWRPYIYMVEHFTIESGLRESGLTEADEFDDENYPRWEEHAIKRLPSGVFVWRDDLEHTSILKQAFIELYIGSDSDLTSRKPLAWLCGGALNLDAYLPPTMRPICMEGFEAFLPPTSPVTPKQREQPNTSLPHGDQPLIDFQLHRGHWSVTFSGQTEIVKTTDGMQYYKYLIDHPRKTFSGHELKKLALGKTIDSGVTEKQAVQSGLEITENLGDCGETLDRQAITEFKKRLKDILKLKEIAEETDDKARLGELEAEEQEITGSLRKNTNYRGKSRRSGSPRDNARSAVSHALKLANRNIRDQHPKAAEYLLNHIKAIQGFSFQPDPSGSPLLTSN